MVLPDSGYDIDREEAARRLAQLWAVGEEAEPKVVLEEPVPEPAEVYQRTIARLETVLRPVGRLDGTHYDYIPAPYSDWLEGMAALGPANGRTFLDVGVGIGTKALMAWKMGYQPFGIDIHQPYLDVAREVLPVMPTQCIDANEFEDWAAFDVVYIYPCMIEIRASALLINRIVAGMRPGAHLYTFGWLVEVPGCDQLSQRYVWQKR